MKAAIFDMDGTLLDSMGMWHSLVPAFLKQYRLVPTRAQLDASRDMGLYELGRYLVTQYDLGLTGDDICALWDRQALEAYLHTILPKPFAPEVLAALRRRGVRLAIATLTPHGMCEPALARHGLDTLFDCILTTEDVGGIHKSRPDIFLEAARRMETPVSDCVVFEDSLYAINTALRAGFPVYAVADAEAAHPEEIRRRSTRFLESWRELLDELLLP